MNSLWFTMVSSPTTKRSKFSLKEKEWNSSQKRIRKSLANWSSICIRSTQIPPCVSLWKRQSCNSKVRAKYNFGILLSKLFWPTVRKKCSSDWEKLLKFETEGQEFANIILVITKTICLNSERSEQFSVPECFFNLFLQVSQI